MNNNGDDLLDRAKAVMKRLRDTPNWMREGFRHWKDNVRTYDRAPFEASDRIEALTAEVAQAEDAAILRTAEIAGLKSEVGALRSALAKEQAEAARLSLPEMRSDLAQIALMEKANWKPAATYWKEQVDLLTAKVEALTAEVARLTAEGNLDEI